jgi:class 3 adenylate cyclase
MGVGADEPCPLPTDPLLAEVALAMDATGQAAWILDAGWRFVYVSDDARSLWTDRVGGRLGSVAIGDHIFSSESLRVGAGWQFGVTTTELWVEAFRSLGGLVLADAEGGRSALRSVVDPSLRGVVDELVPCDAAAYGFHITATGLPGPVSSLMVAMRVRDEHGSLRGTVLIGKPAAPMSVLGGMAWERDLAHLERMERFTRAGRYPAAILFADLEGSSALMRNFSTATVFTFGRRLVRAADRCVVDAGGLVGRHVGDGVGAFFPAETSGSASAAARACIAAARALRGALSDVAARSDLAPDALVMRFGLHWGSAVYIGKISTLARAEVTALGNDVNAAARIEACATGGRVLASKDLVERLVADDATALGIDPRRLVYTQLGDLDTATFKARQDAPHVAVCEL